MQTRLCTLGLSLLLCLPAVAKAPNPAPAPPAATPSTSAYHWQKITLNHIAPAAALVALHWDTPAATLPAGIQRVYGLQSNHSLLLQATDAGLAEATRLVQTIDQMPAAQPDALPQVRLQLSFVSARAVEVDNLGVTFDPAPIPPSEAELLPQIIQLRTATGNDAFQLYQTLARKPDMIVSLPAAVTADKVSAEFAADTQIPYLISHSSSNPFVAPPIEKKMQRLQTSLSITPRINADGSVTLIFVPLDGDLNAPQKALKVPTAKSVSSGQVVALSGLPFSKEKPTDDQELLVFVTPTILGAPAAKPNPKPIPAQIQIRLNYGVFRVDEVKRFMPSMPAAGADARYLVGKPADKVYQNLIEMKEYMMPSLETLTSDSTSYNSIGKTIPGGAAGDLPDALPISMESNVSITPHVNPDGSVTVSLVPTTLEEKKGAVRWPRVAVTQTVHSGVQILLISQPVQQTKSGTAYVALMFVTPTILSAEEIKYNAEHSRPLTGGFGGTSADAPTGGY